MACDPEPDGSSPAHGADQSGEKAAELGKRIGAASKAWGAAGLFKLDAEAGRKLATIPADMVADRLTRLEYEVAVTRLCTAHAVWPVDVGHWPGPRSMNAHNLARAKESIWPRIQAAFAPSPTAEK